jgi:hypothetical protein
MAYEELREMTHVRTHVDHACALDGERVEVPALLRVG